LTAASFAWVLSEIAEIVFEDDEAHGDQTYRDTVAKQARGLAALFRVAREVTWAHPQADEHALIEPHMHEIA
jgi:hypothetical protein